MIFEIKFATSCLRDAQFYVLKNVRMCIEECMNLEQCSDSEYSLWPVRGNGMTYHLTFGKLLTVQHLDLLMVLIIDCHQILF